MQWPKPGHHIQGRLCSVSNRASSRSVVQADFSDNSLITGTSLASISSGSTMLCRKTNLMAGSRSYCLNCEAKFSAETMMSVRKPGVDEIATHVQGFHLIPNGSKRLLRSSGS